MFSQLIKKSLILFALAIAGCTVTVADGSGFTAEDTPPAMTQGELREQAEESRLRFLSCGGVIYDASDLARTIRDLRVAVSNLTYLQLVSPGVTVNAVNRRNNGLSADCIAVSPRVGGERKGSRNARTKDGWEVELVIFEQPNGFLVVYVNTIDARFVG